MRTSALFDAKTPNFLNLWCVRTVKGVSQYGHFSDKEKGVNFS